MAMNANQDAPAVQENTHVAPGALVAINPTGAFPATERARAGIVAAIADATRNLRLRVLDASWHPGREARDEEAAPDEYAAICIAVDRALRDHGLQRISVIREAMVYDLWLARDGAGATGGVGATANIGADAAEGTDGGAIGGTGAGLTPRPRVAKGRLGPYGRKRGPRGGDGYDGTTQDDAEGSAGKRGGDGMGGAGGMGMGGSVSV